LDDIPNSRDRPSKENDLNLDRGVMIFDFLLELFSFLSQLYMSIPVDYFALPIAVLY
jgi:hypothetical protein